MVLTRKGSKGQGVGGQSTREWHKDVRRMPLCTLCIYIFLISRIRMVMPDLGMHEFMTHILINIACTVLLSLS